MKQKWQQNLAASTSKCKYHEDADVLPVTGISMISILLGVLKGNTRKEHVKIIKGIQAVLVLAVLSGKVRPATHLRHQGDYTLIEIVWCCR